MYEAEQKHHSSSLHKVELRLPTVCIDFVNLPSCFAPILERNPNNVSYNSFDPRNYSARNSFLPLLFSLFALDTIHYRYKYIELSMSSIKQASTILFTHQCPLIADKFNLTSESLDKIRLPISFTKRLGPK
jgi:hypothetical protein